MTADPALFEPGHEHCGLCKPGPSFTNRWRKGDPAESLPRWPWLIKQACGCELGKTVGHVCDPGFGSTR